jgi:hypothetical protein
MNFSVLNCAVVLQQCTRVLEFNVHGMFYHNNELHSVNSLHVAYKKFITLQKGHCL